jgi:cytochrome c peroxidase
MRLTLFLMMFAAGGTQAAEVPAARLKMFAPLPAVVDSKSNPVTEAKVNLGRMLYFDKRLSKSGQFSCNSCHDLAKYGVDGEPTSLGHNNQRGDRNSPTVYNAAGHFSQFWDGRAADVEEQAKGPVLNPVEMAMPTAKEVVAFLKSRPGYVQAFKAAFPGESDPVTFDNMARAIGAFERRLVTPSRWDKFLQGDLKALTDAEKAGLNKFLEAGCATCHMGPYLGGNMFQKLGVVKPYPEQKDMGRYQVTKNEADRMMFKVPSLRNIDKTGPYFHDGKVPKLEMAVAHMADYQLGRVLSAAEIQSIITFLRTLTGPLPAEYIKEPKLP